MAPACQGSPKWWAMLGVGLGVLMSTLDASIVNISLPTLVQALDTSFAAVQWVVLSYLLVITSLMLSVARLGDLVGKKKLYNAGLLIFALGSLLCGLSPTVGWLIACRALQGVGAATMTALSSAIITEVFPAHERGRALGIISSIVSVGIALGPSLGGILIGSVGWRAVFLVNVPIGLLAAVIVYRVVPQLALPERKERFDFAGAALLLVVLGSYALAMTLGQQAGFDERPVLGLLAVAAAGLAVFVAVQLASRSPMIDLTLFRNLLFGVNLLMGMLVFIVVAGQFLFPFFLQLVKGCSVRQAGLLVSVFPLTMGVVAPISGALADRFGPRTISLIGLLWIAGACLWLGTLSRSVGLLGFALRLVPLGVGVGMFGSPNNSAVMGAAPPHRLGIASGLLALSRTLGQTTGLPLMGAIFSSFVAGHSGLVGGEPMQAPAAALVAALAGTYRVAAGFIAASAALAAFAVWFDRRRAGHGLSVAAAVAEGPAGDCGPVRPRVQSLPGEPRGRAFRW